MFIPNGFIPSTFARRISYDEEGRLREFNLSRQSTGGIGDANSLYATDAERFDSIAPFLKKNIAKDVARRDYRIQPGGACLYFSSPEELQDPYGGGKVQYTGPDPRTSFGHDSMPGRELQGVSGASAFTVSNSVNVGYVK